jgi:hypothetical protein
MYFPIGGLIGRGSGSRDAVRSIGDKDTFRSFKESGHSRPFPPGHQLVLGLLALSFNNRGSIQVSLEFAAPVSLPVVPNKITEEGENRENEYKDEHSGYSRWLGFIAWRGRS